MLIDKKCKALFMVASVAMNLGVIGNLHGSNPLEELEIIREAHMKEQSEARLEHSEAIIADAKASIRRQEIAADRRTELEKSLELCTKLYNEMREERKAFHSANYNFWKNHRTVDTFSFDMWNKDVYIHIDNILIKDQQVQNEMIRLTTLKPAVAQQLVKSEVFTSIKAFMENVNSFIKDMDNVKIKQDTCPLQNFIIGLENISYSLSH